MRRNGGYVGDLICDLKKMRAAGVSDRLPSLAVDDFLETGSIPPTPRVLRNVEQFGGKPTSSQYFGVHRRKKCKLPWEGRIKRKGCNWRAFFATEIEVHTAVEKQLDKMNVQKR